MNMCVNAYEKINPKNKCKMYFCHRFDNKSDLWQQLCIRQRYCTEKGKYVFYKECQCAYYDNKYIDELENGID